MDFGFLALALSPSPKPSKPRIVASERRIRDVADPADDFVFTATMSTPLSFRAPMASVASVGHRAGADAPVSRAARAGPSHFVDRRKGAGVRCTAAARVGASFQSRDSSRGLGQPPSTSGRDRAAVRAAATEDAPPASTSQGGIPDANLRKDASAEEYALLKQDLLKTTALYGTALTGYCTLGYGLANGFSAALGVAGSVAYLLMLQSYVDELEAKEGWEDELYTRNLVYEPVTDVFGMMSGAFGKVGQVYSQALLQKRLVVPVCVVVFASGFNRLDLPFDFNYGPVLLGFVTYKAAVLSILYKDIKGDITRAIAGNPDAEEEQ